MKTIDNKLTDLPFDLYTRHYIVANLVNNAIRSKNEKLTILDLGGYAGKTDIFFSDDNVTVLDVYDSKEKNYIKGDATNLSFSDSSFDIVCNFDVFEHIPRDKRIKFITEAYRVAKKAVILTMPIDSKNHSASDAEELLNNFYKNLTGKGHPWLKEHIEYGIPTEVEVDKLLEKLKLDFIKVPSNNVSNWKLMQVINFLGTVNGEALESSKEMNQYYNQNIDKIEQSVDDNYRGIYVISKDKKILNEIQKILDDKKDSGKNNQYLVEQKALEHITNLVAGYLGTIRAQNDQIISLQKDIVTRDKQIKKLDKIISSLRSSLSWKITKPARSISKTLKDLK